MGRLGTAVDGEVEGATRSTLTLASDVAVAAAEEFDKLLATFTSRRTIESFDEEVWRAIDEGGWLLIGQESDGARFHLLDLVELAIVWGTHLIPAPYISTAVAQRWIGAGKMPSKNGFTYSLTSGAGALVPFGALPGTTFLSSLGIGGVEAGRILPTAIDDFAPSLPLVHVASGTICDPQVVRETIVLHAAEAIGICDTLLRKTVEYANFRKAYGQEIGKFQAIRHRLADVHRDIETCRGLVLAAVNDEGQTVDACRLVARLARGIVEQCLQTHGAIGFTWDLGIHRQLRHTIAIEKLLAHSAARGRV
jgi:alkylation response protein AidB-like acyl-CoA dehydrogenase